MHSARAFPLLWRRIRGRSLSILPRHGLGAAPHIYFKVTVDWHGRDPLKIGVGFVKLIGALKSCGKIVAASVRWSGLEMRTLTVLLLPFIAA